MSARGDPSAPCCFCNSSEDNELQYGKFYEYNGIVTHYYCLLLSSNMEQKGKDEDGILGFLSEDIQKELRRGKRLVCSYCRKIGATLGCCNVRCKRIFHLPCGLKSNSLHQFFGEFRSYCVNHRPKQDIDDHLIKQIVSLDDTLCYICYDKVDPKNLLQTLWAPCCKKDAWFHRTCIQQLALSAGYFFKCPLCNNNKDFQAAMLEHGIFIPSQDASWELVPNAFEELLYRHNRCDAAKCLCPKGRKYTSSNAKWELALCRTCGSQGIHMFCGQLKWANPLWECAECTSILNNSANNEDAESDSTSESSSQRNSDMDSDSDSDISVGNEFPLLYETKNVNFNLSPTSESSMDSTISLKLRPGPRCFKLQQLLEAAKLLEMEKPTDTDCSNRSNNSDKLLPKESPHIKEKNETSKENTSQKNVQESAKDDSQDDSQKGQSSNDKKFQPISQHKEKDVITIEIDDDDDDDEVQIISFERETNSSTPQSASGTSLAPSTDSKSQFDKTANSLVSKESSVAIDLLKTADAAPDIFTSDAIFLNSDDLEATIPTDTNGASVMNIKISNVTSLPAEVFESVPDIICEDVKLDINSVTETLHSTVSENELQNSQHISITKRNMCEEENNAAENCKKIKVNNFNKRFRGNFTNHDILHNVSEQENERTSVIESTKIGDKNNRLSYTSESTNGISNFSQNNNLSTHSTPVESSAKNEEGSTNVTIFNNNPVYVHIPLKHENVYRQSNMNLTPSQIRTRVNTYNMLSSDILPQVKNNHQVMTTVNKDEIILVTQSNTTANAIVPTTVNENPNKALDEQKSGSAKKRVPVNVSSLSDNSVNHASCDGDAGTELTGARSTEEEDPAIEPCGSVRADCSPSLATTHGIFPKVTNNLNTCHQPRLTPQYMDLRDLKFRICESGNIQMILYDTFSVKISMDHSKKRKIRSSSLVAPNPKKLCTSTSRSRSEASSSFDCSDGASTAEQQRVDKVLRSTRSENYLINDKTKCITRGRDEAKENLDPIKSKTLLRRFNNVNLTSEASDTLIKSDVCDENDDEIRAISSDNSSALNRTNCSMNVDNVVNDVGFVTSDRNKNLRINEDVKQPNQTSSAEKELNDGARPFCKETIHNFDLSVINANKNAEKVLHDNITVSTRENSHIVDDIGDHTDDMLRLSNNKHADSMAVRLKTQDQSLAQVSNVFNEDSVHKQIDAYDSRKFIRCRALNESFINRDRDNRSNCSNDSFKVSIDLNKIQNLIDTKPELFSNEKQDDEWQKCTSRQASCTQEVMCNIENNKNINHQSLKNGELQISNGTSNVEQTPINRDTFSSISTFVSYQKSKRGLRYLDKCILD